MSTTSWGPGAALVGLLSALLGGSVLYAGALGGCAAQRACVSAGCRADAQIDDEVEQRIGAEPQLLPPSIVRVTTHHRVVYLTGQVATPYQQELASAAAHQVPGVIRVVNSIAVTYGGR